MSFLPNPENIRDGIGNLSAIPNKSERLRTSRNDRNRQMNVVMLISKSIMTDD